MDKDKTYPEQVRQFDRLAFVSLLGNLVNALILAIVLRGEVPDRAILSWIAVILIITALRSPLFYRNIPGLSGTSNTKRLGAFFVLGAGLSGLAWGSTAVFLFPARSMAHQVFLAFILGGMTAGAAGLYAVLPRAFPAFSLPALLPVSLRFLMTGFDIHGAMGIMVLFFLLLMILIAHRTGLTIKENFSLIHKNEDLFAGLSAAKDRAEVINRELASEVAQRRAAEKKLLAYRDNLEELVRERNRELTEANEELKKEAAENLKVSKALGLSEEKYSNLFQFSNDGIIIHDLEGNILDANRRISQLLGYSRDELISLNISDLHHQKDHERSSKAFKEIKGRGFVGFEIDFLNKNGTTFPAEVSASRFKIGEQEVVQGIIRDISERKILEKEVIKAQKLESVGIFAGGIAHDFNNLLTAILGNVTLAKIYVPPDNKAHERLTATEKATIQARDLTRQLLTFAKGGAPIKKPVYLPEIIREAADFSTRGSKVKCDYFLAGDLMPVNLDEGQFTQVINNLTINARQAMPAGGVVEIRAENITLGPRDRPGLTPGDYVKISFADQGSGIPPEHATKIFDPYFTTKNDGNGLGLAVSYSIIKNHAGLLMVNNNSKGGATFTIYLPACKDRPVVRQAAAEPVPAGDGRILIMDDEEIVREVAVAMLKKAGYETAQSSDGKQAVELYQEALGQGRPYDAVIIDLTIPGGMGGEEAVKKLLAIDPDVKAIVSSGYANDPIMARYREYGFCAMIPKPYRYRDLCRCMNGVLRTTAGGKPDSDIREQK